MHLHENQYIIALDDDPMINRRLEFLIQMKTLPFKNPRSLLREAGRYYPFAAFIDINLGTDLSGLDIIKDLKRIWGHCPIFVMTSDQNPANIEKAFAMGADDFIRKPLVKEELVARLMRYRSLMANDDRFGDLLVNTASKSIRCLDQQVYLQDKEIALLKLLMGASPLLMSRDTIMDKIWEDTKVSKNVLDRRLTNLRKALKEVGSAVSIVTEYGKGFRIEAPLQQPHGIEPENTRILVVDDNALNREVVGELCRQLGYETDQASDGLEALEMAKSKAFDLIFMDIQMPRKDGLEATREILQRVVKPPAIVAMVGRMDATIKLSCQEAGMVDSISKPLSLGNIKSALDHWASIEKAKSANTETIPSICWPEGSRLNQQAFSDIFSVRGKNGASFVCELFDLFLTHAPENQLLLESADGKDIEKVSHRLRGMAENIGAQSLASLLNEIESKAQAASPEDISVLIDKERAEFHEVVREIENILDLNRGDRKSIA